MGTDIKNCVQSEITEAGTQRYRRMKGELIPYPEVPEMASQWRRNLS